MAKRLLFIQYAGDYREAFNRFAADGLETYYAQKYSVDAISKLKQQGDEVATLCCLTATPYDEILDNGVRAMGAGFDQAINTAALMQLVIDFDPTHLVLRTPSVEVLRWAIHRNIKTIVTLADSFNNRGIRGRIENIRLTNLLNHRGVDWVANHGITASFSLKSMGIKEDKIIPWDWPHSNKPSLFRPKSLPTENTSRNIIFVGNVIEEKGISDLLRAIKALTTQGESITLKVIGKGELDRYTQLAKKLNIENHVEFLGTVSNSEIIPLMRAADAVVIPSRHAYPEGFPMTIYEALCSRSPIIISDHPMFCDKLSHGVNALVFPAGNAKALANCIEKLFSSPDLYQKLSAAADDAWQSLQLPTEWGNLIDRWLSDSTADRQWLFENCLASGRYYRSSIQILQT